MSRPTHCPYGPGCEASDEYCCNGCASGLGPCSGPGLTTVCLVHDQDQGRDEMTPTEPIYDRLCRERGWIDHRTPLPLGQVRPTTTTTTTTTVRRRRGGRRRGT